MCVCGVCVWCVCVVCVCACVWCGVCVCVCVQEQKSRSRNEKDTTSERRECGIDREERGKVVRGMTDTSEAVCSCYNINTLNRRHEA